MLAKMWKKVLLAICILACIFNIMSKLVNKHSLKANLESANDGETVFNFFGGKKEDVKEVDNVGTDLTNDENNIILDNSSVYVQEDNNTESIVENSEKESEVEQTVVENEETTTEETTAESSDSSNKDTSYKYQDLISGIFPIF